MNENSDRVKYGIGRRAIAIEKADRFAMKPDINLRAMTNRAIIQELGSQMQLKAQKMKLLQRTHVENNPPSEPTDNNSSTMDITPGPSVSVMPASSSMMKSPASSRLPVFSARQRRRDGTGPQKTNKHRRNVVQDYRPGYTWNRGGRVKELKIRCIARKYLHLWKRRAFGRVLPSAACLHYRRRLLKQTFGAWSEMWWELRKEWGLSIRADLHNRYRLWNKVWHAWREYTLQSRVKTIQKKIADHHASSRLCGAVLQAWHVYIEKRRTKKELYKKALEVYGSNLVSQTWHRWQQHHDLCITRKHQEVAALQHWANSLMGNMWHTWRSKFLDKQLKHQQQTVAIIHHNTTMVHRCYLAWCVYIIHRRQMNIDRACAVTHDRRTMLNRYMSLWHGRLHVIQQIQDQHTHIEQLGQRSRCRRVFNHWKYYVHLRHMGYEKNDLATRHYKTQLLQTAISAWKLFTIQQRNKQIKQHLSLQFYYKTLIQRAWLRWLERCEEKEDMKLITQSRRAYRHHQAVIRDKAWRAWKQYVIWRQYRKRQYLRADVHFITHALPRCMERWKVFTEESKTNRQLIHTGAAFRRENLLARFFYTWHSEYERCQDERLAERMAVLHHEETSKRYLFTLWSAKTQDALEDNFKMSVASEHHDKVLCQCIMRLWKGIITDKKKMIVDTHTAVKHWYIGLMRKILQAWKQDSTRKRHKKQLQTHADVHHQHNLLRLTFTRWQHYHGWCGEVNVYVEEKVREKNKVVLRKVLNKWHHNVQLQKLDSEKQTIAVAQHNTTLLLKIFERWHHYAALRAHKKQKTEELVSRAQNVLNQGKVKRYLDRWRVAKDSSQCERHKDALATTHHNHVIVIKAWRSWRDLIKLNLRKQLLMRQAMWMHNTRITANYFLHWKTAQKDAQEVHNKTNLALWHWCVNLQHKVLYAWISYTSEKRRKSRRITEALECHRLRLLRQGTTQWLQVAADMTDMRQKFAQERGAKNYYRVHQVVLRCASHWRHLVMKRKAERARTSQKTDRPITSQKQSINPSVKFQPSGRVPSTVSVMKRVAPPVICASPAKPVVGVTGATGPLPQRAAPRKPSFLLESLKREGLYQSSENSPLGHGDFSKLPHHRSDYDNQVGGPASDRNQHNQNVIPPMGLPASTKLHQHSLPFLAYGQPGPKGDFVGMETSTSLGTDDKNQSLLATGNTSVMLDNISSFPPESIDLMSTDKSLLPLLDSARTRSSVVTFGADTSVNTERSKASAQGHRSYLGDLENDLEPRPPPHPSLEHSKETNFERSDDLNISVSVVDSGQSDTGATNSQRPNQPNSKVSQLNDRPSLPASGTSGNVAPSQSNISLLPPMAFMFYKDGTPISDTDQYSADTSSQHPSTYPTSQPPSTYSASQGNPPISVTMTTETYRNPAEELVDIRKRLKQFQSWKKQIKHSTAIHKQLKSWVDGQTSQTHARTDGQVAVQMETDPDVQQAQEEILTLEEEIMTLNQQISSEKPYMHRLTERVQKLLSLVSTQS